MDIRILTVGRRSARKQAGADLLFSAYKERIGHCCRCRAESFASEEKLLAAVDPRAAGRTLPMLVLLDSRGRNWSTESFARWLGAERDQGVQQIVFAVGPADGWSLAARTRAGLMLSLGPMTLPHELAAVVLAEQIYRAFTILEGLPYHLGHASE